MFACVRCCWDKMYLTAFIFCNGSVGGGWRVYLHHPRGPGHRLFNAHAQCPWIQVKSNKN